MWVVEVNVLGHRFTRRVNDGRDGFRFAPRMTEWRQRKDRGPRAVA
jgi:hypothetical protein